MLCNSSSSAAALRFDIQPQKMLLQAAVAATAACDITADEPRRSISMHLFSQHWELTVVFNKHLVIGPRSC
jgi:hypothetical protein